ncbi:MAG: nucleotidyltransferase domain-containing protein [Candidatus Tectomicrobia bacterium]|nr:nucleotidyltransferase domain-containing protein [Candidatus Tectomicrobia bacterium]
MNAKLKATLTELRCRFEALYGDRLVRMVLYGSQARGDAEPGSDIDILVVLKGSVSPGDEIARTGETIADLSLQFDEVISCVFMDEDRFTHRNGPFLRNIRKEGIVVCGSKSPMPSSF